MSASEASASDAEAPPPGPGLERPTGRPENVEPGDDASTIMEVPRESWRRLRSVADAVCGCAVAPEVLVAAACLRVVGTWSRSATLGIEFWRGTGAAAGATIDGCEQPSRAGRVAIDDLQSRSFADAVRRLAGAFLDSPASGNAQAPSQSASVFPALTLSFSSVLTEQPGPNDRNAAAHTGSEVSRPGVDLDIHAEETSRRDVSIRFAFRAGSVSCEIARDMVAATGMLFRLLEDAKAWDFTAARLGRHLLPVGQLSRRREVNATHRPLPDGLLHSGFLKQATHHPARPAVITLGHTLTYGQLYGHACGVAHALVSHGVHREELVAIIADKGWEQVAAVLGISLSGAAYLPVDRELPPERIRDVLERARVRIVLTQARHLQALRTQHAERCVLAVDELPAVPAGTPLPATDTRGTDLAYVIFTSGSTGIPKGVMIEHRSAWNTIADLNERFAVGPLDRVLALSRLSFDLSVYDIFGMLAAGGAVVLPDPHAERDPEHWLTLLRQGRVTLWNTVPALMQLLVDYVDQAGVSLPDTMRLVWMSGDWIPLSLPSRIRGHLPQVRCISMGGATEASIWSILHPIETVDPAWRSIPYGKPMANQTFHVLRENLAPAPDGVVGELFIGGIGVARGYWGDPQRTADRFVTHPDTGERLYRTGDLGRFHPNGTIEFLGRADFQVKLRGFRIELGEIESALAAEPRVRAAVVVAHGDSDANRRLVAYIVRAGSSEIGSGELQRHLRQRLPEYMVPSIFVQLDRLPLTANGKVDVKSLPPPDAPVQEPRIDAPPETEIESILADLWRDVLSVATFGIRDDFFALGGNSLLATRLIIRLRSMFSIPLPVDTLTKHPTIHQLARALEEAVLAEESLDEASASSC